MKKAIVIVVILMIIVILIAVAVKKHREKSIAEDHNQGEEKPENKTSGPSHKPSAHKPSGTKKSSGKPPHLTVKSVDYDNKRLLFEFDGKEHAYTQGGPMIDLTDGTYKVHAGTDDSGRIAAAATLNTLGDHGVVVVDFQNKTTKTK